VGRRAILDCARLDEPAADDEASASDAATAVDGADAPLARVVLEHGEDLADVSDREREAAIWDREGVIFDFGAVNAQTGGMRGEVRRVWGELAILS